MDFLQAIFDTSTKPPRWKCGLWETWEGLIHIIPDVGIFIAYAIMAYVILSEFNKRFKIGMPLTFLIFGFFMFCATSHLLDAIMFYWPAYRFLGIIKVFTVLFSWAAIIVGFNLLPFVRKLKTPEETLEEQIAKAKTTEDLQKLKMQAQTRLSELDKE